jgi:hypothetical protein
MFSVNYSTLLQIIERSLYTGIFRAKVTPSRFQPRDGYIELHVKGGVIETCHFITRQGQVDKWDQWESQLAQFGTLSWELTPLQASRLIREVSPSTLPAHSQQLPAVEQKRSLVQIPHHTKALPSWQLHQMPRLHRQVYSLIDGKRQCSDIANVLHKSRQEINRIVDDLGKQGLIQLR